LKNRIELIATATFGLEAIVAREVKNLGYEDVSVENARVSFKADLAAICRTNLWLRTADRVLIKVGQFKALTYDELFEGTKALPWDEWLPENALFPVEGKSINSKLFSVPDCQSIVKKAIVEKLKQKYHTQWFEETGPKYTIEVALLKDMVTLTIDTSGAGLHKRGYRKLSSQAPLKETLAAAMIDLSFWNPDRILVDPFCGSGTIPIEAALIGLNIAPGSNRQFVAEQWPQLPANLWQAARQEAADQVKRDLKLKIAGYDIDPVITFVFIIYAEYSSDTFGNLKTKDFLRLPFYKASERNPKNGYYPLTFFSSHGL
jgi:putative N6-adenine-specific DNA methylase